MILYEEGGRRDRLDAQGRRIPDWRDSAVGGGGGSTGRREGTRRRERVGGGQGAGRFQGGSIAEENRQADPPALFLRGKVHGSLARAGKVKSQTPKVEPQEKKKKVCGRAKKRIIYNRRFVNVRLLPSLSPRTSS